MKIKAMLISATGETFEHEVPAGCRTVQVFRSKQTARTGEEPPASETYVNVGSWAENKQPVYRQVVPR